MGEPKNAAPLPKLTLGTVQLGLPYGIHNHDGMPSEERSFGILREAWKGGVVCYDTAAAYGQSEDVLGRFFEGKRPTIVTKIHLNPEPGASVEQIEREMRSSIEQSLSRLRINSIPVVMLHNTRIMEHFGDKVTDAFQTMLREGLIGQAGISVATNTEDEYRYLSVYLEHPAYEAIQLPMSVLDHRPVVNGCLGRLAGAGKTVYVRSVFLQGLLYMKEDEVPDHLHEAKPLVRSLQDLSERHGVSIAQMAVSYIRDLEGVDSLVIGAETEAQVRANLELVEGPALSGRLREEIAERFSSVPEYVVTPPVWRK